jgi:hypothetical protein
MPRFVVLEHDHPVLHWDLMLEADGVLHTWRLAQPPLPSSSAIEAMRLPDHRMLYLEYEGPVSGDRGVVKRWDAGVFKEDMHSSPTARILEMHGKLLQGCIHLDLIDNTTWRLEFLAPGSRSLTPDP